MKKNVGVADMVVRVLAGAALLFTALQFSSGAAQGAMLAGAVVLLLTGALRFCPLYPILGLNTKCGSCKSCTCKGQQGDA